MPKGRLLTKIDEDNIREDSKNLAEGDILLKYKIGTQRYKRIKENKPTKVKVRYINEASKFDLPDFKYYSKTEIQRAITAALRESNEKSEQTRLLNLELAERINKITEDRDNIMNMAVQKINEKIKEEKYKDEIIDKLKQKLNNKRRL